MQYQNNHIYQKVIAVCFSITVLSACDFSGVNIDKNGASSTTNVAKKTIADYVVKTDQSKQKNMLATANLSGQTAFIDPQTGELTSEPSEQSVNQLEAANQFQQTQNHAEPLVLEYMPDGSIKINLQKRFHLQLNATMDKNGDLILKHQSPVAKFEPQTK